MKSLPQRISLVSQTADILRQEISADTWPEFLPGERELSARLRVSRPTVRSALALLRREGWLEPARARQRCGLASKGKRYPALPVFVVALLTPVPLHQSPPFVMFWVNELRQRLAEEGCDLEIIVSPAAERSRPEQILEKMVRETRAAAWVLLLSSELMQRWFAERGLPCVIAGSCFPGLLLPSVDIDVQAACRHAAGVLIAQGHRLMALLLPEARTAGELASEAGFLQGASAAGTQAIVVRHNETVAGLCKALDRLLRGNTPVRALLVARSVHALTALTYLQSRGLKLPRDVALISRDNDAFLSFAVPSLARYSCNPVVFATRVSRLVLQLAKEGAAPPRQILLAPELIKGETCNANY